MPDRLPPPWTVRSTDAAYIVMDANGCSVAWVYWREEDRCVGTGPERLSRDQARRIAANIAKLPALLSASAR